jgi:SAM-dependent methyltransferase
VVVMSRLKRYVLRQQFRPGVLGLFVNPFYFARKELLRAISRFSDQIQGETLDVGCGHKPYEHLFHAGRYIGLEIDTPHNRISKRADFFYDGGRFPFSDRQFDSVICNEVLEHVFNPDDFLAEIHRVLRYEGRLLLTVPFVWDEHEQPNDYARYSSYGLRHLLQKHDFEVIGHAKTVADGRVIFQLVNGIIYKKIRSKNSYLDLIMIAIFIAPFNVLGALCSPILPSSEDLYLDNVLLARRTSEKSRAAEHD